ncbi:MAG TPA: TolC family protein, partial [Anaeromyxobacteraceae bacterium]|nr:TolC family protein [Anaeromyxobacteraceae bacterium]
MISIAGALAVAAMAAGARPGAAPPEDGAAPPSDLPQLSLAEALDELDRQNLTIAQARARADEASGVARQAAAPLLPTATASGTYLRNSEGAEVAIGRVIPGAPTVVIQPDESVSATGTL